MMRGVKHRALEAEQTLNSRAVDLELLCDPRTRVNNNPILDTTDLRTSNQLKASQAETMHKIQRCSVATPPINIAGEEIMLPLSQQTKNRPQHFSVESESGSRPTTQRSAEIHAHNFELAH
jgi:hypothetical protein